MNPPQISQPLQASATEAPHFSVVIITYKRPQLLRRAVESVLTQTYCDWELIVSDDEREPGESWRFLEGIAKTDARIRITRNPSAAGQVNNINHAMSMARGRWIKPLYDDDALKPHCLEVFARATRLPPEVALITCLADHFENGQLTRPGSVAPDYEALRYASKDLLRAMYLHEPLGGGGMPTLVAVNRNCIQQGIVFEQAEGLVTTVDSWWFIRLATYGDQIAINQVLVDFHQGGHESITSAVTEDAHQLDGEFLALRGLIRGLMPANAEVPSVEVASQLTRLIRASHRVSRRKIGEAAGLTLRCYDPRAWLLFVKWLAFRQGYWQHLRQAIPTPVALPR